MKKKELIWESHTPMGVCAFEKRTAQARDTNFFVCGVRERLAVEAEAEKAECNLPG